MRKITDSNGWSVSIWRVMANGPTGHVRLMIGDKAGDFAQIEVPCSDLLDAVTAETTGRDS